MQRGFTIVELLIVIVVIGILASISIVSYNGFQRRAQDASVQSDLEAIGGELESYRTRDPATNPTQRFPTDSTQLATLEIQAAKGSYNTTVAYNMIYCVATTGTDAYQAYKLVALSKSGAIFLINQDGFQSHTLTAGNLTATFCADQGMTLGSNGMTSGPTWSSWVRTG